MNPDIRWRQRFENFDRALGLLREALADGQGTSLHWSKREQLSVWNTLSNWHGNA